MRLAKHVNEHTQRADRRLAEGFHALGQAASLLRPVITRNLSRAEWDDPAVTQHRPGLRHQAGLFGGTCPPVFSP